MSLTAIGATYSQDFDTLAASGTSSALPQGWWLSESGSSTRNDGAYTAGTGSSNTGDTYSFGSTGSIDRALGGLLSGTLSPTFGVQFTNDTGETITALGIGYVGEQWRLGTTGRGPDQIDFEYSTDATSLTTGTWLPRDSLDFSSPFLTTVGAVNGNLAANRATLTGTIGNLSIAPGASFWIRWTDFNVTNADDGLAVDQFSITPAAADAAPQVVFREPAAGASDVARGSNVTIGFSEAVALGATWYDITCATTGTHAATVSSGGPNVYILDPSADFGNDELCTVTVYAGQVTDADPNDPPDSMAADDVFTFRTADVFACGDPAPGIHEVQGSGAATPLAGSTVTVEGVVVGDYQLSSQFRGFFLQEEEADIDTDPETSEGIFVFHTATNVAPGDVVRLRGTASEFFGQTQIGSVNAILICGSDASVPATTVTLPFSETSYLERYEGMLVGFAQTLTVTEVFHLGRFGEVMLSGAGRLYTPTAVAAPGADALAVAAQNARSRIVLDDGDNRQNIDPTVYPQGGLSASNTLRVGDTLPALTGVMDFRFGVYRIQPVGPIAFDHTNARTAEHADVGGNVEVASFNVLNFFNGDGLGGGFPTARGAETHFEYDRQLAKLVSALSAIDADVVGLMEIENDGGPNNALAALVAALNDAMGAKTYAYVDTGVIGTDAIKVALIYRPGSVMPLGTYETLDSADDPRFIDTLNRPALAQTFEHILSGQRFTVVVNHLKSKGSDCNAVGDFDAGDGQGNCNGTRTAAAEALADWLATDPTGSGDSDVLIIGDLNAYTLEDPIAALEASGFTNLVRAYGGTTAYSYVFQGESGYLDHALGSSSILAQVTGVTEWHLNPDEPTVLDYNTNFKSANHVTTLYDEGPYRSSDHDPVIVGLQLGTVTGGAGRVEGSPGWEDETKTKLHVHAADGTVTGRVAFERDGRSWLSTRLDALLVTGPDATIFGAFGDITFRVDVHDGGSDRQDTFRLRTSDGYDSGVLLQTRGNVTVWP